MSNIEIRQLRSNELLSLYADIMEELRRRGVVRSSNNPGADFAENLAAKALGLKKANLSTKGFDAVDQEGRTYQVKSRRMTEHSRSRQLSAIREFEDHCFDFLIGVLFNRDFSVSRACLVPYEVVKGLAVYRSHTNAWIVHLRDEVWDHPQVREVTTAFVQASET
jgi:hypothetical protein